MKITVVIRDDSPMIFCGDSPKYRTVVVKLNEEQEKLLECKKVGCQCNTDIYEAYSQCILEN